MAVEGSAARSVGIVRWKMNDYMLFSALTISGLATLILVSGIRILIIDKWGE